MENEIEKLKSDYLSLKKEISIIQNSDSRALRRGVLSEAGATTEKILKFIYRNENLEKNSKPADKMMIDELLTEISKNHIIPIGVLTQFRTLQQWRNIGSHDKGDIIDEFDQNAIITVNTSVAAIVNWLFNNYLKTDLSEHFMVNDNNSDEDNIDNSLGIEEWTEHYWWAMKTGQIKLIDQKSLDSIQKKHQISEYLIINIKENFKRQEEEFNLIIREALEDKNLEELEIDALEHSRIECCVSIKEAKEIIASKINHAKISNIDNIQIPWLKEISQQSKINSEDNDILNKENSSNNSSFEIGNIFNDISNKISFKGLFGSNKAESNNTDIATKIEEWTEYYWQAMSSDSLKLIDEKSLETIQKKNQISDSLISKIKERFNRKIEEFNLIIDEALEDRSLKELELEAIEHSRLECCISIKEAKEILASKINVSNLSEVEKVQIPWLKEILEITEDTIVEKVSLNQEISSNGETSDIEKIFYDISIKINFKGLYWSPNIPENKVKNAYKYYKIPLDEKIIGLIDATLFGSAENGLALCNNGIYLNNDWTSNTKGSYFISYSDFIQRKNLNDAIPQSKNEVFLSRGIFINLISSSAKVVEVETLFKELENLL
jgi:hypothetical protein